VAASSTRTSLLIVAIKGYSIHTKFHENRSCGSNERTSQQFAKDAKAEYSCNMASEFRTSGPCTFRGPHRNTARRVTTLAHSTARRCTTADGTTLASESHRAKGGARPALATARQLACPQFAHELTWHETRATEVQPATWARLRTNCSAPEPRTCFGHILMPGSRKRRDALGPSVGAAPTFPTLCALYNFNVAL
jgi:hypothetical protein